MTFSPSPLEGLHFPPLDQWVEGIYFGLPARIYHALPWLGSTDMKTLYASPADYWWESAMNPVRPAFDDDDTPARQFGTAIHHCVLYGRDNFDQAYRYIEGETGEEASAEGLKLFLDSHGIKPMKLKVEKVRQIKEELDLTVLTERRYQQAVLAAAMILKNPHLVQAFTGGWPEVSIFWRDENGLPMKCRHDYFKLKASVDIKSLSTKQRIMPFDRMVLSDIVRYRYDMQAAHYLNGRRAAYDLAKAGKIYGPVRPDQAAMERLAAHEEPGFVFVVYKTDGAPVSKSYQIAWGSPMHGAGRAGLDQAITNYLRCRERFGTDAWVNDDEPYNIDEEDLPKWL